MEPLQTREKSQNSETRPGTLMKSYLEIRNHGVRGFNAYT